MPTAKAPGTLTVDELFERARHAKQARAWWRYVGQLQRLGTEAVFENAVVLLAGTKAEDRSLGAYVLSQLGYERNVPPFRDRSIRVLLATLETEEASQVLEAL